MSPTYVPSVEMLANQRQAERSARPCPATSSGLAPTGPTSREASVDPATMHSVIGRNASPALIGE